MLLLWSDAARKGGSMRPGPLAFRKQTQEPEMGCFSCFGTRKQDNRKPLKKDDSGREGQSTGGSANNNLTKVPSGEYEEVFMEQESSGRFLKNFEGGS